MLRIDRLRNYRSTLHQRYRNEADLRRSSKVSDKGEYNEMNSNFKLTLLSSVAAAAVTVMTAGTAHATFGMLPHCVGTVKCAMGGAGSAVGGAAVDAAMNPALAGKMGNTYQVNLGMFQADVRGMSQYGTGVEQKSDAKTFPNGSLGVNYVIDANTAFNLSIVPGGGGASDWPISRTNAGFATGATNDQHVDYKMLYVQPSYAKKMGSATYGIGAILSRSTMNTDSLNGAFTPVAGADTDETFYGVGLQVGGVWDIAQGGSFALNLRSPVWHQDTGVYDGSVSGPFNDPIDTPAQITGGLAFDIIPGTMIAFDVKWVNWSGTNTIGNPSNLLNGTSGFAWDDQLIGMVGIQHEVTSDLTLRVGASHGNSPIDTDQVLSNFLFPAIVTTHFTAGGSYALGNGMVIGASGYVTPTNTIVEDGTLGGAWAGAAGSYLKHSQKGFQLSFSNDF